MKRELEEDGVRGWRGRAGVVRGSLGWWRGGGVPWCIDPSGERLVGFARLLFPWHLHLRLLFKSGHFGKS